MKKLTIPLAVVAGGIALFFAFKKKAYAAEAKVIPAGKVFGVIVVLDPAYMSNTQADWGNILTFLGLSGQVEEVLTLAAHDGSLPRRVFLLAGKAKAALTIPTNTPINMPEHTLNVTQVYVADTSEDLKENLRGLTFVPVIG